jgi:hypothetical protein
MQQLVGLQKKQRKGLSLLDKLLPPTITSLGATNGRLVLLLWRGGLIVREMMMP